MKYRATCTILWDFETDLPYNQALELARKNLDDVKLAKDLNETRFVVQIDKLKSKVEKITLGEFTLDEVMPFVTEEKIKKEYEANGKKYLVKMNTDRYFVFKNNMSCVSCGLLGTRVFLECHANDMIPHFNLYGEESGRLVLFTKDHIKAKAFGGTDEIDNFQTMCSTCNSLKAHSNLDVKCVKKLRDIYEKNKKKLSKKQLHILIEEQRNKMQKPWEDVEFYEKPTKDALVLKQSLIVIDFEGELVAVPDKEDIKENTKLVKIKKGSFLQSILEINDYIFCNIYKGKVVKIHKKYIRQEN